MSHLYVMNSGDAQDSADIYSCNDQQSYNSWKYGDEASLYSIAEDSREDRASEVPSVAGTAEDPTGTQVEVRWAAESQATEETECINGGSFSNSDESHYRYGDHSSRRKYMIAGCLILLVALLGIVLGVTLSQRNEAESRTAVGAEGQTEGSPSVPSETITAPPVTPAPVRSPSITPAPFASPAITPAPIPSPRVTLPPIPSPPAPIPSSPVTPAPIPASPSPGSEVSAPNASPTNSESSAYTLAESFVYSALTSCPGTWNFESPTSIQGQVYEKLVAELYERMSVGDEDGFINFPLYMGVDYLKEKYALEVLYLATSGDAWTSNNQWNTASDPCSGWFGINSCRERKEGSCAITAINLGKKSGSQGNATLGCETSYN